MKIDVIDYTKAQLDALKRKDLLLIKAAQLKKNALDRSFAEKKRKEKERLLDNGTFLSGLFEEFCQSAQAEYDDELEYLKESLVYDLLYKRKNEKEYQAPYEIDFTLSEEERMQIVLTYYMNAYSDGEERFEAFSEDAFAKLYVGECYKALYDALLEYA